MPLPDVEPILVCGEPGTPWLCEALRGGGFVARARDAVGLRQK